jgi:hypothetical protein
VCAGGGVMRTSGVARGFGPRTGTAPTPEIPRLGKRGRERRAHGKASAFALKHVAVDRMWTCSPGVGVLPPRSAVRVCRAHRTLRRQVGRSVKLPHARRRLPDAPECDWPGGCRAALADRSGRRWCRTRALITAHSAGNFRI